MNKVELSGRRWLVSTFDKGKLYAPFLNMNITWLNRHLRKYAQKVKGRGADLAADLLQHLILAVERINRHNQGETIGYICSYGKLSAETNHSKTSLAEAAKWLEKHEWLTISKHGNKSVFNLNVERINECLANPSAAGVEYDNEEMWAALLKNRTPS